MLAATATKSDIFKSRLLFNEICWVFNLTCFQNTISVLKDVLKENFQLLMAS